MGTDRSDGCLPEWLPALLQLASPALPTGAFSYSQGLETACEVGLVSDEDGARAWIDTQWRQSFAVRELPAVKAAYRAVVARDAHALREADHAFVASRDSAEARAETRQVGAALLRWLSTLYPSSTEAGLAVACGSRLAAPSGYALCCAVQGLPERAAVFGWGFAWLENQVQAAVKLVPLGQTSPDSACRSNLACPVVRSGARRRLELLLRLHRSWRCAMSASTRVCSARDPSGQADSSPFCRTRT
jgi:urease accessory protein